MKRLLGLVLVGAMALGGISPAYADHGGYRDGDCEYGGCGEREEEYGDNSCKYVCPDFKDSPVHDAFNFAPVICLPGSTCTIERQPEENRQSQPQ